MPGWKFTKFFMPYLKPKVSFSLNFASFFSAMRVTHFITKALNHLDKEVHQSVKFQTFDCSQEICRNLYSDSVLLMKVYKISTKKVRRSCVSWKWKVMQKCFKNICFKNGKSFVNVDPNSRESPKCALWLVPFAQRI